MMTNSERAVNTHFYSAPTQNRGDASVASKVTHLPINMQISATRLHKKTMSFRMLAAVTMVHMVAVAGVLNAQPETAVVIEKSQTPMMVSLVSQVADAPKEMPEPPVKQVKPVQKLPVNKPVLQKQPLVEKKPVVNEDAVRKVEQVAPAVIEKSEPVVAESAPTEQPQSVKAMEVAEKAVEKVAAEPVIEPPSFGAAYLNNPAPAYPVQARRMGEQGKVLLKVLVSQEGKAETVKVDTSSGHHKLDQAAIEAVKKWSFVPAKRSNQPISAYVLVPVNFTLNG